MKKRDLKNMLMQQSRLIQMQDQTMQTMSL